MHLIYYEEIKKDMHEQNYNFTKSDYCNSFDKDAKFFTKTEIQRIKNKVPDLYTD